ncbi:xaa-Pro aminopeptidase ApepP-like isoform X1 [Phymastichus coffea]|uniref:xaa-Pro aminopeptidase ApepP-like isoform X1 n=1 Tax=Phymastichus coffea TaxID=108790 RepID=UPI00273B75A8|nr:xaa-Pro aminopeptidase ApepP-like isoform X1 [Phymastichus coffea]XP_058806135.1 xaa-Pro aminopeptidase ApepP-like isoform X1 [Phymastichus coffea]
MVQKTGYDKLKFLRQLIKNLPSQDQMNVQAYIITGDDAHQSEYIQEQDKRREYISGFKGSAGTAVITLNHALLWTDGRYFAQAKLELDPLDAWILMKEGIPETPTIEDWLIDNIPTNALIGTDPNFISHSNWLRIENCLRDAGLILFPVEKNLVDIVWGSERPTSLKNNIVPHEIIYSGINSGYKVNACFDKMKEKKVSILVITALDEIAYLLNLRGSDIPYNPVFIAYAILFLNRVHLFIEEDKLSLNAKKQMKEEKVDFVCHPYNSVQQFLREIIHTCKIKIWLSHTANHALHILCSRATKYVSITPISLMKVVKNRIEIEGMKLAHVWDAIALVKYFSWLEANVTEHNKCSKVTITEISGAEQLEKFRKEEKKYVGPSFPTISAVGRHGAIIHYQPSSYTDIAINCQEIYLCDAGAHFVNGTTDITRTLHFGQPSVYERECFTRVLKGQLQLSMSKFPSMIKGNYLDTLARKFLWDVGLDYLHGTGHGVGAYLNVHEYPTMISWKPYPDDPGLQNGMFLSNEPGYYEDGKFGIRLENIELVINTTTKYNQLDRKFLTFETVTLVPIQNKMIEISMLTNEEIEFLNSYHKRCYKILFPYFQESQNITALQWLEKETQPIIKIKS